MMIWDQIECCSMEIEMGHDEHNMRHVNEDRKGPCIARRWPIELPYAILELGMRPECEDLAVARDQKLQLSSEQLLRWFGCVCL